MHEAYGIMSHFWIVYDAKGRFVTHRTTKVRAWGQRGCMMKWGWEPIVKDWCMTPRALCVTIVDGRVG